MLYKRQGFPEEGENVVCTVTKVHYHSVFASMNEYPGKSGLLHISEISPGRIRNIYDYVKVGKVIVCKVLRIDTNRGHIDLSLRRVSDAQRIKKMNQVKQEQKAEKIIEDAASELKTDAKKLYEKISKVTLKQYNYVFDSFYDVVLEIIDMDFFKLDKKETEVLEALIRQRIKRPLVEIKGRLKISSIAPDGVEVVKKVLSDADSIDDRLTVRYLGAGVYGVDVVCEEFREAEELLDKAMEKIDVVDKKTTTISFEREEGKSLVKNT